MARSAAQPVILVRPGMDSHTQQRDMVVEKIILAEPGVAYPRCTGGRRDAPPEDCGGIWVFNEQFADLGDLFNVGELNERLADLATVLIPAQPDLHQGAPRSAASGNSTGLPGGSHQGPFGPRSRVGPGP